ncbi:hypothetical protein FJT64_000332 [Amphibalanus amphitrite]|uniref:Uncharacterized protein n=1 Tax=Amphibalanus amphitrite TaxID=1232801 RepID=A0A6A4WLX2_AMPAM|nr:hypothetical protein FJT64_000332 [Amphibalanus amphitrite]
MIRQGSLQQSRSALTNRCRATPRLPSSRGPYTRPRPEHMLLNICSVHQQHLQLRESRDGGVVRRPAARCGRVCELRGPGGTARAAARRGVTTGTHAEVGGGGAEWPSGRGAQSRRGTMELRFAVVMALCGIVSGECQNSGLMGSSDLVG